MRKPIRLWLLTGALFLSIVLSPGLTLAQSWQHIQMNYMGDAMSQDVTPITGGFNATYDYRGSRHAVSIQFSEIESVEEYQENGHWSVKMHHNPGATYFQETTTTNGESNMFDERTYSLNFDNVSDANAALAYIQARGIVSQVHLKTLRLPRPTSGTENALKGSGSATNATPVHPAKVKPTPTAVPAGWTESSTR